MGANVGSKLKTFNIIYIFYWLFAAFFIFYQKDGFGMSNR